MRIRSKGSTYLGANKYTVTDKRSVNKLEREFNRREYKSFAEEMAIQKAELLIAHMAKKSQ